MVRDVRANLDLFRRSCSVCYMIAGEEGTTHTSGVACMKIPLESSTDGWEDFKKLLTFVSGLVCWYCLLPTVRIIRYLQMGFHGLG